MEGVGGFRSFLYPQEQLTVPYHTIALYVHVPIAEKLHFEN